MKTKQIFRNLFPLLHVVHMYFFLVLCSVWKINIVVSFVPIFFIQDLYPEPTLIRSDLIFLMVGFGWANKWSQISTSLSPHIWGSSAPFPPWNVRTVPEWYWEAWDKLDIMTPLPTLPWVMLGGEHSAHSLFPPTPGPICWGLGGKLCGGIQGESEFSIEL